MGEDDYIELNTLLAKLRVHLLKEISEPSLIQRIRDMDIKLIRNVDNIRRNMPLKIEDVSINYIE